MPKNPEAPRKSPNAPNEFHESLVQPMPQVVEMKRLTKRQTRIGMYAIWGAATIVAGGAIGLLINSRQVAAPVAAVPSPVAQANLSVAALPSSGILPVQPIAPSGTLSVVMGSDVNQADSGTPLSTVSEAVYQPAQSAANLDPGYTNDGGLQGTIGTAAVK